MAYLREVWREIGEVGEHDPRVGDNLVRAP